MKRLSTIVTVLLLTVFCNLSAQQVSTLYFLENAPMRHTINPAFQPVSDGYVNFTPLGYSSMWFGNNSLDMSDVIFNLNGTTVTAMHPDADHQKFLKQFRKATLVDGDVTFDLLSFGFRHKQKGYVHIGIMERLEMGISTPKSLYEFALGGGMKDLTGVNSYNLKHFGARVNVYTEISGGYSYQINEKWTVGGKVKFLLGQANLTMMNKSLTLDASAQEWYLHGQGSLQAAAPINFDALPRQLSYEDVQSIDGDALMGDMTIMDYVKPAGYGVGFDLGFTYKPHPQVQITAALNDLGFIVWKGASYKTQIDSAFTGIPNLQYSDYANEENDYKFDGDKLGDDVVSALENYAYAIHSGDMASRYTRMLSAKLNVGVDANFCNNILGVGIVSKTRLFNNRLYEEVTLGGAVRPCNWFNLALSYSLVNNGKYSNFGAGLSFMPYDGINLTLAMDYIPTSYAYYDNIPIPYKTSGVNVAFGFSIVWGTNKPDSDKDGVWNKLDMCPDTPASVEVDDKGCPIDSDGDGVPDYLDKCPDTKPEAIAFVDADGCDKDTDGDGVPDYMDRCMNTKPEAIAFVDSLGCDKDTDGDGVADYMDKCPNTLPEAVAFIDEFGCDKDSDGDGIPDYMDKCETRPEAINFVDSLGCDKDTDGDGVMDYEDECPTVAGPANNKGCPVIKKEVRNLLKKAMQGIQFETGKSVIKKNSYAILDKIATVFFDNPTYVAEVQGHTDNTGKAELNKTLSQKRADAVRDYLIKAGVQAERLTAVGYGPDKPIADNATAEGRALNRRVEFDITFEQISYEEVLDHADTK